MRKVNKDTWAALGFLVFSLAYGWQSFNIEMFPFQEFEPFTPRTWPFVLAVIGIGLAILQLGKSLVSVSTIRASWGGYDWFRVALLTVSIVIYAWVFTWLGFIVATTLFLLFGYLLLGERRVVVLLAASLPVSFGFWAIMTQLLGLYLAPGDVFRGVFW